MTLRLFAEPADLPVSLEEVKLHLREDSSEQDELITIFIRAATEHAQTFTGRALVDQEWELTLDAFPASELRIPLAPLIAVTSIKYDDGIGDEQTLPTEAYRVDMRADEASWIVPVSAWPATLSGINAVRVRFRVGYEMSSDSPDASTVPPEIKVAIMLMVGTMYEHRETVVVGRTVGQMPWSAEQLLRGKRVHLGMA
jgi:uncharacterized phiE125 gp8 family phage protein